MTANAAWFASPNIQLLRKYIMVASFSLKQCLPPPSPRRTLLIFLGWLLLSQVVAVSVEYAPWQVVATALGVVVDHLTQNFRFAVGALGVLGLINIYIEHRFFRKQLLWVVCALSAVMFVVYTFRLNVLLPADTGLFHRVSLFTGLAVLAFCLSNSPVSSAYDEIPAILMLFWYISTVLLTVEHKAAIGQPMLTALLCLIFSAGGMIAGLVARWGHPAPPCTMGTQEVSEAHATRID